MMNTYMMELGKILELAPEQDKESICFPYLDVHKAAS
jgi:hypothetical protein